MNKLSFKSSFVLLTTAVLVTCGFFTAGNAMAVTVGPNNGSTFADNSVGGTIGSYTWNNPSNVQTSDNTYATTTISSSGSRTHYLEVTNFGFSIPAGATVNGIQVNIEKKQACTGSCTTSVVTDDTVEMVKGGTVTGSNYASATAWPTSDTVTTYGAGTTDKWGAIWTVADINASNFGVVLSATRNSGGSRNVSVDHISITVYYTISKTNPTLSTTNSPVIYNGFSQSATVVGSVAGTVNNIKYNGSATTPTNAGTYAVTADFVPTDTTNYNSLTGASAGNFVINKATPTISVTNSPVTYNGSAQSATVTGSVAGTVNTVRYNGSATVPTSANTYPITASFTPTDATDYNSLTGTSAGNFVISKASSTTTITCTSPVVYTGSAQTPCTVSVTGPGGLSSTPVASYSNNTNVGTASANYTFAGDTNHNGSSDSKTFSITKANPNVTTWPTASAITYGQTLASSNLTGGVATPAGIFTFTSASTVPNGGTASQGVTFTPNDTANYNTASGTTNVTVNPANQTITFASLTGKTYGDSDFSVSATSTSLLSVTFIASGNCTVSSLTVHLTGAGSCTVTAHQAGNGNYNSATDVPQTFSIAQKSITASVTASGKTYDGNSTAVLTGCTPNGIINSDTVTCSATSADFSNLNVGTWTVTADGITLGGAGAGNYTLSSDTATTTASISQRTLNITSATGEDKTYDGSTSAKLVLTDDRLPGDDILLGYNASFAAPDVGDDILITISSIYISGGSDAGNYTIGTVPASTTANITQYAATVSLDAGQNLSPAYDGTQKALTFSTTPSGLSLNITYNGSSVPPTGAGDYTVVATVSDPSSPDYAGTDTETLNIAKVDPNCSSITGYSVAYDGDAHTATGTCQGVGSDGTLTGLDLSGTTHTNADTYASDAWTFTDSTGNYNNANGTVSDMISQVPASITVTPYAVSYDDNPHTATVKANGAKEEDLSADVNLSATTNTDAGTYAADAWTFTDPNGNYTSANGTVSDSITKVDATINVAGYTGVYDGNPHGATGTATGVKEEDLSSLLHLGSTFTDVPGGTANWTFDGNTDYNSASGSADIAISQAKALISVSPYTVTYDGTIHAATGTATGVKTEDLSSLFDFSKTQNTDAGTYATDTWTFTGNTDYASDGATITDTINPAALTVTASDASMTYGGTVPTITPNYSGFVGTDTSDSLTTAPTCATTATSTSDVGTYPSTCSGAVDANYTIIYKDGTVTVNPIVIDIAAISGATVPARGVAPVAILTDTSEYTAIISWNPADNPFAASTVYTATITISPKKDYTLTGVSTNFFTVTGATATNEANSGLVTAVFPATQAVPVNPPSGGGGGGGQFTPPATLVISNIVAPSVTTTSLTLDWTTNLISSSYVIYSTDAEPHTLDLTATSGNPPTFGYAHATPELDTNPKVLTHSVTITGLNPFTTYYFRTVSRGSLAISEEYKTTTPSVLAASTTTPGTGVGPNVPNGGTTYNGTTSNGTVNGTGTEQGGTSNNVIPSPAPTAPVIEKVSGSQAVSQPSTENPIQASSFAAGFLSGASHYVWQILIVFIIICLIYGIWYFFAKRKKDKTVNK